MAMDKKRLQAIKRKHATAVTKFLALTMENADKVKCMLTFTPNEPLVSSAKAIRKSFLAKVKSILKRKQYKGYEFKYFANIELGENIYKINPHLHIQCFTDSIEAVKEAFEYVVQKYDLASYKFTEAQKRNVKYDYVIKEYQPWNFDVDREEAKDSIYKGEALYSCSKKKMPDYLIKRLYTELGKLPGWDESKDKYKFITELINQKRLIVKKFGDVCEEGYKRIKNWLYRIK